jgi:S1-C subfamily serine protease
MRRVWVAAAVCGWLAVAGAASAQQYAVVAREADGATHSIDTLSIRIQNGYVLSWEKVELRHDRGIEGELFRHWHTSVIHRVDNCRARASAVQSTVYYDLDDKLVKTVDQPKPVFREAAPGSSEAQVLDAVCRQAQQMAGERRRLNFGPESKTGWVRYGATTLPQTDYYYDPASISDVGEGYRAVKLKMVTNPATAPPNTYPTSFTLGLVNCEHQAYLFYVADYYNAVGALAHSEVSNRTPSDFAIASPGSVGMSLVSLACNARVAPPRNAPPATATKEKEPRVAFGTGWLGPKGYILTAAHVIKGADRIALVQNGEPVATAEVVTADEANDVAVLKPRFTKGTAPAILSLRRRPGQLGERVFTLGFPAPTILGAGLKMTSGEVSSTSGLSGDPRELQISVPVQPGNSGGPLMDEAGEVVGVVVAQMRKLADDIPAQNVNYAVKETYLEPLLQDLPDLGGRVQTVRAEKLPDLVAAKRASVFLIVVEGGAPE